MNHHQITELDIIDVLLGQAVPEVEERVHAAVRSNTKSAALYDQWARIIPAMGRENMRAKALTQRACDKVMARLDEDRRSRETLTSAMPVIDGDTLRVSPERRFGSAAWKRAVAVLAACAVVTIVFWMGLATHDAAPHPHSSAAGDQQNAETVTYVAFSHDSDKEQGSESQPFTTLSHGIAAVSPGGTLRIKAAAGTASTAETPRITKAMRIEALGGSVRIGEL